MLQQTDKTRICKSALHLAFLFCIFFFPKNIFAESLSIPMPTDIGGGQWQLAADSLTTISNGAIIEAKGDVVLTRGEDTLKADLVRYYTATQWVFVKGNVELKSAHDILTASEAELDLRNLTGFLHDGEVQMEGQHLYLTGNYVEKHYGNVYTFETATLTTCDPNDPLWELSADKAVVDIDGEAKLTSVQASLSVVSTPPIPRMSVSLVDTRDTGFLPPRFGSSSSLGYHYTQPFFWAIDEGRDLTIAATYYTKHDIRTSLKYRAYPTLGTKLWISADYVFKHNSSVDDRYWLRGMAEGDIFDSSWKYRIDIDYVSDSDYILDYRTSYFGHEETVEETYSFFGREFAPIQDNRLSAGYIYNTWKNIYFTAGFVFNQNPDYGSSLTRSNDPTVQILPQIATYLYPLSPIKSIPLQLDTTLVLSQNYRREGTSGFAGLIDPRISVPIDFKYFSILPQIRVTHRNYITQDQDNSTAPLESTSIASSNQHDTTFDIKIQTFLQASRVWEFEEDALTLTSENIGKSATLALQHRIEPKLTYLYTPSKDQTHLPYYTQSDRTFSQNEFQFSLHNIISSKEEQIIQTPSNNDEILLEKRKNYNTLARFTLGAAFDFEEAQRTILLDQYKKKPFRDLTLDTQIYAFGLGLNSHLSVSVYGEGITAFDLGTYVPLFALEKYLSWHTEVSYRNTSEDYYNIVRYDAAESILLNEKITLLRNTLIVRPTQGLAFNFEHYINLEDTDTYTWQAGVDFYHECLHFGFDYVYSEQDQSVNLRFSIPYFFD